MQSTQNTTSPACVKPSQLRDTGNVKVFLQSAVATGTQAQHVQAELVKPSLLHDTGNVKVCAGCCGHPAPSLLRDTGNVKVFVCDDPGHKHSIFKPSLQSLRCCVPLVMLYRLRAEFCDDLEHKRSMSKPSS